MFLRRRCEDFEIEKTVSFPFFLSPSLRLRSHCTIFCKRLNARTVGQITIFLDINRIRHKMVKNAIKVGNLRRKTSLGPNFFV